MYLRIIVSVNLVCLSKYVFFFFVVFILFNSIFWNSGKTSFCNSDGKSDACIFSVIGAENSSIAGNSSAEVIYKEKFIYKIKFIQFEKILNKKIKYLIFFQFHLLL